MQFVFISGDPDLEKPGLRKILKLELWSNATMAYFTITPSSYREAVERVVLRDRDPYVTVRVGFSRYYSVDSL